MPGDVVFFGEQQVLAIYQLMLRADPRANTGSRTYRFIDANAHDAEAKLIASANSADAIVLQVILEKELSGTTFMPLMRLDRRGRLLKIPLLVCKVFWPFDTGVPLPQGAGSGLAALTRGDSLLVGAVDKTSTVEAAVAEYLAQEPAQLVDLDALLARDAADWALLDQMTDVPVAMFILTRFKFSRLFNANYAPSNILLALIAGHVARFLDLDSEAIGHCARLLAASELLHAETPVHPKILDHLGVAWAETRYRIGTAYATCEDWARDYARARGLKHAEAAPQPSPGPLNLFASLLSSKEAQIVFRSSDFLDECVRYFGLSKSQLFQDVYVLHRLGGKRGGFFVEFGATDGLMMSNTFMLEKHFGWTGILAEPFPHWHEGLLRNRSCVIDLRCVWTTSGQQLQFAADEALPEYGTINEFKSADIHKELRERSFRDITVETVSLNDLLEQNGVTGEIDYLSVDTEGSEFLILSHFDFIKYRPKIITVEHNYNEEQREAIRRLLESHGFTRELQDYSRFDDWYCLR